jgi:branched-chain amino acid transport system substrate-binding protein
MTIPTRATRTFAAGLVVAGLIAAGCGSDDDSGSSTDTTEAAAAAQIAPPADISLPAPVSIVALISDPGNSKDPNAIADFNDGIKMAVDEINSVGGIGGHEISFQAVDTSPTDPNAATNSLNIALGDNPTAILGPISSTTALALAPRIAEAGVPTIVNSVEPGLAKSQKGNEWIFVNRPVNTEAGAIAGQYAVEELGADKVGVLATSTAFGTQGVEGIKAGVSDAGGSVDAERTFEFNATDLTEQVTAMQGSGAVVDWGTPNTLALSVTTFAQQGMTDTPHIGPGSVGFPSFVKAVGDDSLLDNVYGTLDCNPADDPRETTQQWAQRFEDTYGYAPSYASAEMYDAVYMLREVIESAGSADAAAIQKGLNDLNWDGGVCAQTYSNKDNFLVHQAVMAKFEDGKLVTQKEYTDLQ